MRGITSRPSVLPTWWRSTSRHHGPLNVKLLALFCRSFVLHWAGVYISLNMNIQPCIISRGVYYSNYEYTALCYTLLWALCKISVLHRNCWRRLAFWASLNVFNLRLKSWQRCCFFPIIDYYYLLLLPIVFLPSIDYILATNSLVNLARWVSNTKL